MPLHQSVFTTFAEAKQFFLSQALAINRAKNDKDEILVQRIVSYIQDYYADPSLNLSNMAEHFGMKESFLYHFMQTRMETSFAQYVETYRLERSLVLFSEKQMTIGEITTLCGYSNPQTLGEPSRNVTVCFPQTTRRRYCTEEVTFIFLQ